MRKLLILLLSMFLSLNMMAQLEVKEGSFKEVEGFVNINTEMMYDDNDKPYAVLKVKTENINDKERRQLLFQGDARTFIECEYNVGEVWLYISYYATYLKISHPDFGSTEFWLPFDMKGKKGYELTLFNKPSVDEDFQKRLERLETELGKQQKQTVNEGVTPHYNEKPLSETYKNKALTKSFRKKLWVLKPEIGCGVIRKEYGYTTDVYHGFCLEIDINMGYHFNPFIYLGVGLGANRVAYNNTIGSLPLYINPRFYLNNRRISLYIDFKCGYAVSLMAYTYNYGTNNEYSYEQKFSGICGAFEVGVEAKHSCFGLSLVMQQFQENVYNNIQYNKWLSLPIYFMFKYSYNIFLNKK